MTAPSPTHVLDRLLASLDVRTRAVALCEAGVGWSLALDAPESPLFHYVLRGSGTLHIDGGGAIALAPFMVVLVPKGRAQRLEHGPARNQLRGMEHRIPLPDGWMRMSAPDDSEAGRRPALVTACGMVEATYAGSFGFFDRVHEPIVVQLAPSDTLRGAMEALLHELAQPQLGTRAIADALMKQCLVLLVRRLWDDEGGRARWLLGPADPRLQRALALIVENPAAAHTLIALAREAGMSRSAFAARFALGFGRSPMTFLRAVRLRRAAQLLETTDLPVATVAGSVGFRSRTYFSRAFRAAYGSDPQSYRSARAAAVAAPHVSGNEGT